MASRAVLGSRLVYSSARPAAFRCGLGARVRDSSRDSTPIRGLSHSSSAEGSERGGGGGNKYVDAYRRLKSAVLEQSLPSDIKATAIFANNEINLSEVEVYGFDYDYTLASYTESLKEQIYQMGLSTLIRKWKYPPSLENLHYNPHFAVQGLHFDLKRGFLMKIDAFHQIQKDTVYRGMTQVPWSEVLETYQGAHVPADIMNSFHGEGHHMQQLISPFVLPEVTLLAQVIEYLNRNFIEYDPEYVFWDVRNAVQSIHASGELHNAITSNLDMYLEKGPQVAKLLQNLRRHGKKLFLITNSAYPFIEKGMTYMVGSGWRDLFDVIIINARKPHFFAKSTRNGSMKKHRPFRVYDETTNTTLWHRVSSFQKGKIYCEGNVAEFRQFTDWVGSRVMYFGDQVYTDLADATLQHGWRTGAILPELETEINILNSLAFKKSVAWLVALQELIESSQEPDDAEWGRIQESWLQERDELRVWAKKLFNPYFGSLFRTYHNPTYFSRRLQRFADIYTSSVVNLLEYSLSHTFYPRRGALAHERIYTPVT